MLIDNNNIAGRVLQGANYVVHNNNIHDNVWIHNYMDMIKEEKKLNKLFIWE